MSSLRIALDRLCWYTRGQQWDYTILCWPRVPHRSDWLRIVEEIFKGIDIEELPSYLAGQIQWERILDYPASQYVAAAFLDPTRRDRDGRRIKHYLIYLLTGESTGSFRADWCFLLIEALANAYDRVFSLDAQSVSANGAYTTIFNEKELLNRLQEVFPATVHLDSKNAALAKWHIRDIFLDHANKEPASANKSRKLWLTIPALAIIGLAVALHNRTAENPIKPLHANPDLVKIMQPGDMSKTRKPEELPPTVAPPRTDTNANAPTKATLPPKLKTNELYIQQLGVRCEKFLSDPGGKGHWESIRKATEVNILETGNTSTAYRRQRIAEHCKWLLANLTPPQLELWDKIDLAARRDADPVGTHSEAYIKTVSEHCKSFLNTDNQEKMAAWRAIQDSAQKDVFSKNDFGGSYYRQRIHDHCLWFLNNKEPKRPDWWDKIDISARREIDPGL